MQISTRKLGGLVLLVYWSDGDVAFGIQYCISWLKLLSSSTFLKSEMMCGIAEKSQ